MYESKEPAGTAAGKASTHMSVDADEEANEHNLFTNAEMDVPEDGAKYGFENSLRNNTDPLRWNL
jgi:hypothetical protein